MNNKMIIPHDFQERLINEVLHSFIYNDKVLMQAMTGAGKTVIFSFLARHFVYEHKQKVVILCHKEELVEQTIETLKILGFQYVQAVYSKTKRLNKVCDVYVCMVETIYNRLSSGKFSFENVGLLIADEAHILIHNKNFDFFSQSKILGVTATPVHTKRIKFYRCKFCKSDYDTQEICCDFESDEWTRPFKFSEIYDDIVVGPDPKVLFDVGQLVPEITFNKRFADISRLKVDNTGDFSKKSLSEAYEGEEQLFNCLLNYQELAAGKKTIIYNSSTRHNLLIYEKFKEAGVNVKMYDSVNSDSSDRDSIVNWFKNNRDAVLLNVGCFTTGLDVRDIEAVILNTSTASLSLFLQMVGRGGRSARNIFKENFILIDGGGNVDRFGEWSSPRDWEGIFRDGIGEERCKRNDILDILDCESCGMMYPKTEPKCPNCGHIPTKKPKQNTIVNKEDDTVLKPIREIPPPNAKKIIDYTRMVGEGKAFAFNILANRILDMFIFYRVSKRVYESNKLNGKLERKINSFILPVYFEIIKSGLEGGNRTLSKIKEKVFNKIDEYYETKK